MIFMASTIPIPTLPVTMTLDIAAVEAGVSVEMVAKFLDNAGLELKDIYDVVIPARTLAHRRSRKESLSIDESDKFARVVRTYDHTLRVFGTVEKAVRFLRTPKARFEGRSPLEMLRTEVGGSLVDQMLWQIADGVFI
jgi:putative toxin-antitoxin system antitoxin component (TIGR02293 family)